MDMLSNRPTNEFPARSITKNALIDLIAEQGGSVRTTARFKNWSVYEELANRLNLSQEARTRQTTGSRGQTLWRSEVGYAVLELRRNGTLKQTKGRGAKTWELEDVWVAMLASVTRSAFQPDEFESECSRSEGAANQQIVTQYKRDVVARALCVRHYGARCEVCKMEFGSRYGPIAEGFIHVHHLKPLHERGGTYIVDPVVDLRPVCPNCHAVIHLDGECRSIEEVQRLLRP